MRELWTNWPEREIDGLMKGYILVQWSFWSLQVLIINIEERRKDYWQILTHHFLTIALIAAAYAYHHTRVGNVILVLMDVIELIFPVSHIATYGRLLVCIPSAAVIPSKVTPSTVGTYNGEEGCALSVDESTAISKMAVAINWKDAFIGM